MLPRTNHFKGLLENRKLNETNRGGARGTVLNWKFFRWDRGVIIDNLLLQTVQWMIVVKL